MQRSTRTNRRQALYKAAEQGLSRERLLAELRAACPGRFEAAAEAELALLFRIFDADADGRLTHGEWTRAEGGGARGEAGAAAAGRAA